MPFKDKEKRRLYQRKYQRNERMLLHKLREIPENLYMWFKLYQGCIKDDCAKWDLLNHIRKEVPLDLQHEQFYQNYAKAHGIKIAPVHEKGLV